MSEENSNAIDWPRHVDAWQGSGLSQAAYCRQHELQEQRFSYWKRKCHGADSLSTRTRSGNLVPVHLAPTPSNILKAYLPNGVCVESSSPADLSALIKILQVT